MGWWLPGAGERGGNGELLINSQNFSVKQDEQLLENIVPLVNNTVLYT